MKKYLALLLALIVALCLCACEQGQPIASNPIKPSDPSDPGLSQPSDGSSVPDHTHTYTQEVVAPDCTNGGYTNNTCDCGDSYHSDEVAALGHTWVDATCKAPKTCSVCKATEGNAADHSYKNGKCSVCGASDPSYKALTSGTWICNKAVSSPMPMAGAGIAQQELSLGGDKMWSWRFYEALEELDEEFMDDWIASGSLLQLDGKYYLWRGMADMCEIVFTESGTKVTVSTDPAEGFTIVLQRISGNQLKVTSLDGEAASVFLPHLAVGDVFTWTE